MDASAAISRPTYGRFRILALTALLAGFALTSVQVVLMLKTRPIGVDFAPIWAGALTALRHPELIYDFRYITELQGWPEGPGLLRPFVYPPSALVLLTPLAMIPYTVAQAISGIGRAPLFAWASRRLGAPWWLALFPVLWLV